MVTLPDLVPRRAQGLVSEALADTRVVLVNGARQAGKSTLTRLAADGRPGGVVRLLDDAATLRAAQDDPAGFVEHDGLMVIDEIQLAPELLRAIKVLVDLDPRPGRFLLTGSSRVLALRSLPDALPGRMEVIELWPFSQGEMNGGRDAFIDAALRHGAGLEHSSRMRKRDYLELAVAGGFPEAVRRTPRRRAAFYASYLSTLIERDVLEVSSIERQGDMFRLLALLAGRVSGLLVPGTLAGQAGIPRTTLVRYLELLATVFLIKTIPAWSSGQTARAVGTPKLAFTDTGIACHLIGQDAARLDEPGGAAGPVLENFVVMELARQLTWAQERARLYHYRTKDKLEVDAVIETPDGRVVAVEVKAGATVRTEDLAGLRNLAGHLGDKFVAGYVLYTGQQTLSYGSRIKALPIDALWLLAPLEPCHAWKPVWELARADRGQPVTGTSVSRRAGGMLPRLHDHVAGTAVEVLMSRASSRQVLDAAPGSGGTGRQADNGGTGLLLGSWARRVLQPHLADLRAKMGANSRSLQATPGH